jgi:hypothetical protein
MKKTIAITIFFLTLIGVLAFRSNADEPIGEAKPEAAEQTPTGVGPNKAVTDANAKLGIKLSKAAIETLGIKTSPISVVGSQARVPGKSVLSYQEEHGLYRLRDGWFKLVDLKVTVKNPSADISIQTSELKPGDQVVTEGAELLRLADLNVWSGEEGGE